MEDQKKPNIVSNLWSNWCGLDPAQRSQVADRLGPLGHVLSIAANVHQFAKNGHTFTESGAAGDSEASENSESEDVIDAEFEEVGR
jgi:hypothetical protein